LRTYEALFVVRPDVPDEEVQTVANEVEKIVTDNSGAIVRSEIWGKRRLAYEVKKFTEGNYVLLRFESEPHVPKTMEEYFRLSDHVIRELITYFDPKTLRLEEEQLRRNEAELARSASRPRSSDDDDDDSDRDSRRRRRDEDDDD